MIFPAGTPPVQLFMALVHSAVSCFWAAVFGCLLPCHRLVLWALTGAVGVALLDIRVVTPLIFPSVAALPFGPQFADHLMWGALFGFTLQWRTTKR